MKKIVTTLAALLIAVSVTAISAAATSFSPAYNDTYKMDASYEQQISTEHIKTMALATTTTTRNTWLSQHKANSNYLGNYCREMKKGEEILFSVEGLQNSEVEPNVAVINENVAKAEFLYKKDNQYFYKITAVGNSGDSTTMFSGFHKDYPVMQPVGGITIVDSYSIPKTIAPLSLPNGIKCSYSGTVDLNKDIELLQEVRDSQGRVITGNSGGTFFFTVNAPAGAVVSTGNSAVGTVSHPYGNTYTYNESVCDGSSTGIYVTVKGVRTQLFIIKNYNLHALYYNKSQEEFTDEFLALINNERAKKPYSLWENGSLVKISDSSPTAEKADYLMKAAAVRARELETSFSHVRPSGTTLALVNSFANHKVYHVSEVCLAGGTTPHSAFSAWMNSYMHMLILMGDDSYCGAAYYKGYFVALFSDT